MAHIRPCYVSKETGERVREDRSLIFGPKSPFNCIYEADFDGLEECRLVFEFNA